MRQRRKRTAWLALLGFVLAQLAAAAYACANGLPEGQSAISLELRESSAMATHCAGMPDEGTPLPNLCQAHCQADHQIDSQPQAPNAVIAPPPALTIALSDTGIPASSEPLSARSFGTAPRPSILISRLLL